MVGIYFIHIASQVEHNGVLFLKLLLCRHCSIVDLLAQLNGGCKSGCVQIPPSFCNTSKRREAGRGLVRLVSIQYEAS